MIPKTFDKKLFLILFVTFIAAAVTGTLSHECGHYITGRSLGFHTQIHYSYVSRLRTDPLTRAVDSIGYKYREQIRANASFPGKEHYNQLVKKYVNNKLWMCMGGPLQTMITGTIGLLLLFARRRSFRPGQKLTTGQWTLIFITLFWLRQPANMVVAWFTYLFTGNFPDSGDEVQVAGYFDLPDWSLMTFTGALGIGVLWLLSFRFIPKFQRLTFILAGLAGGVAGYLVWLEWAGPLLLP